MESLQGNPARQRAMVSLAAFVSLFGFACLGLNSFIYETWARALWRDEANSVFVASVPTWTEMIHRLPQDSFPIAWFAVLRTWIQIAGSSDASIRYLGLVIACAAAATLFACVRTIGGVVPTLSIALVATNPTLVQTFEANRAYGLGVALILGAITMIWVYICKPGTLRWFFAALLGLFACQTLYYAAIFVGTGAIVGAALLLTERSPARNRTAYAILGMLPIWGLSAAAFLPAVRDRSGWAWLARAAFSSQYLEARLINAIASPLVPNVTACTVFVAAWVCLAVAALIGLLRNARSAGAFEQRAAPSYLCITAFLSMFLYCVFLFNLGNVPPLWYFTVPLTLAAAAMDCGLAALVHSLPIRQLTAVPALAGVAILAACVLPCYERMHAAETNLDTIAAIISDQAKSRDLVVVAPYYLSPTFARYYHGQAPWRTLPASPDPRFEDMSYIGLALTNPRSTNAVYDDVRNCLASGGTVWIVGNHMDWKPMYNFSNNGSLYTRAETLYTAWNEELGSVLKSQSASLHTALPEKKKDEFVTEAAWLIVAHRKTDH